MLKFGYFDARLLLECVINLKLTKFFNVSSIVGQGIVKEPVLIYNKRIDNFCCLTYDTEC